MSMGGWKGEIKQILIKMVGLNKDERDLAGRKRGGRGKSVVVAIRDSRRGGPRELEKKSK